jgi:hypothetical protein
MVVWIQFEYLHSVSSAIQVWNHVLFYKILSLLKWKLRLLNVEVNNWNHVPMLLYILFYHFSNKLLWEESFFMLSKIIIYQYCVKYIKWAAELILGGEVEGIWKEEIVYAKVLSWYLLGWTE